MKKALKEYSWIKRIHFWLISNFVCGTIFSSGHKPEPFLTETEEFINTKRCSRCLATLGMGYWKPLRFFYWPNASKEDIIQYQKFCNEKEEELRKPFING